MPSECFIYLICFFWTKMPICHDITRISRYYDMLLSFLYKRHTISPFYHLSFSYFRFEREGTHFSRLSKPLVAFVYFLSSLKIYTIDTSLDMHNKVTIYQPTHKHIKFVGQLFFRWGRVWDPTCLGLLVSFLNFP